MPNMAHGKGKALEMRCACVAKQCFTWMALYSPSVKLLRGVRKWMLVHSVNFLSASPSCFWLSPHLIRAVPACQHMVDIRNLCNLVKRPASCDINLIFHPWDTAVWWHDFPIMSIILYNYLKRQKQPLQTSGNCSQRWFCSTFFWDIFANFFWISPFAKQVSSVFQVWL